MVEMHKPEDYVKSISALGLIEIVIYTSVGALGYAFVGSDVGSPALLSAPSTYTRVAFGVALLVIFISGSINSTTAGRYILERTCKTSPIRDVNTRRGWLVWISLIAGLTVVAWLIAEAIPFFNGLLGIISSLFSSGFTFYFPALFWFYLIREGSWYRGWRNISFSVLNALMLVIGLFVLVGGTYANILSIMDEYAFGNVGSAFSCSSSV